MQPKISILISSHNYSRYISACIESAISQSWANVEIIVADDDSTDNSRELIKAFGTRIKSAHVNFRCQVSTVNKLYQMSSGDIIVFLDADDRLRNDAITRLVGAMSEADKITAVKASGYLQAVDHNGQHIDRRIPESLTPTGDYRGTVLQHGPTFYRASYTSGNAWSRDFLDLVMPLDPDLSLGPDGQLNVIAPLFGRVAAVNYTVGDYTVHGANKGPVSRSFSVAGLKSMHLQNEHAREFLRRWIVSEFGADATREWPRTWRELLVELCYHRLSNQKSSIGFVNLIAASCFRGETSVGKRPLIAALFGLAQLVPMTVSLDMYRRMLRLKPELR